MLAASAVSARIACELEALPDDRLLLGVRPLRLDLLGCRWAQLSSHALNNGVGQVGLRVSRTADE